MLEPYERRPGIASIRRLALEDAGGSPCPEADVALEVRLADGRRDVIVAADPQARGGGAPGRRGPIVQKDSGARLDGDLALVRLDREGRPQRVFLSGKSFETGEAAVRRKADSGWAEIDLGAVDGPVVAGQAEEVEEVTAGGRRIWPRDRASSAEEAPAKEETPAAAEAPAAGGALWKYGAARAKITPEQPLWMAGFAARTKPSEGTLDDLWIKVLALEASGGGLALVVALDLVGIPKGMYERIIAELRRRHGLERARILLASSHTHSGPVIWDALQDIYPLDGSQRAMIDEYSRRLEGTIIEAAGEALARRSPATLWAGEGTASFAVNRRTNQESDLPELIRKGIAPKGPSDHAVPVLAVRSPGGRLRAAVFGYAAHASALSGYRWSADYPGYAARALEESHPEALALFHQGCGSDQSAAPRGTVEQCEGMGKALAASVEKVLAGPMRPLAPRLAAAFELVSLDFGEVPDRASLEAGARGGGYRARWARRLLKELDGGRSFERSYPEYPVVLWRLGEDQLWLQLGGEVCVDYAILFKRKLGPAAWVTGYANDVMAYIPSRRIWEEGGYQAGAFDVYGLPALRWGADLEDRISRAVARLAERVQGGPR